MLELNLRPQESHIHTYLSQQYDFSSSDLMMDLKKVGQANVNLTKLNNNPGYRGYGKIHLFYFIYEICCTYSDFSKY